MKYKPYHYQAYATQWIIDKKKSALFLEMGMGKSIATLTAILELMYDYFDVAKVLVIAPLRVASTTWEEEVEKWDHLKGLRISKVLGSEKQRVAALYRKADIYIINRENVTWLVERFDSDWPFDMVVIDELSSFKSSKAQRFKALKKVRPFIKRMVGLTGTPAPNGLIDLWPQIYLLDGGERLGKTVTGYRERYFLPDKRNQMIVYTWKLKEGAEDAIYERISDICVSMKAKDYLELPDRINNVISVELPMKAKEQYDRLEKELILSIEEADVLAGSAAVLANKLLQMANGAVYDEDGEVKPIHDEKLKALDELIETANGKPVLVFYGYQHDKDRVLKHLKKLKPRILQTDQDIKDWNQGKVQVLLAHPASAGHGLNLQTGGNIIIWFGLTWSLELYQQANARLWRQGQKQSVVIHHIIAKDTIDERVMKALEDKDVSQAALMEAVKARMNQYKEGLSHG
ncbi:DEAD/DEAH box helicase [Cytobacillus firmus]|uniref:DEAD/DEAH box helicase n=1 Tax=Cytobacillus firmus TaxID=1399 RepID=UPI0018CC8C96|nr:DEAD/DEAH box helicase [Cytobacillus firmus]MBG9544636.1 DEAD/DEAH box helicase [Cytobacillus firmus]MBG9553630.1 DEAD/DEAH box helicase [Cytobacillus firmus]MBG9577074.1 DEAD/DEAH box helicase [Cytobacillus firmus]MED4448811.1 DEAD/DEAH box helicase [Cytobacillus firmus]MED4769342.1 DEAD/DEAH box helicase [Cytobacillus firmus]